MVSSPCPQHSILHCATGQLSKDTWHHMFPCAVMTAPSTTFMAAGLLRPRDQRHVQPSIRAAAKSPSLFTGAFFYTINTSAGLYAFTLWCNIKRKKRCMQAVVWNLQQKSMRGNRRRRRRGGKMNEQEEEMSGGVEDSERKLREAEWERQRWRQREERETKGMWSSPSLCLAAQWLKRRVPGEREAALGLPSQFSCSLDLLRVAHRNIPPNLQEGLLLLHWIPPTTLQMAPKNLQSKHRLSWHRLLSI